mmetsp:Transcript_27788/g.46679  ORF Transcript_27788/g.46679 Transcript_27788/m.46679 type:complete len:121 (+) Transcript_27788:2-364(+)
MIEVLTNKPLQWSKDEALTRRLKDPLLWLAGTYITTIKTTRNGSKMVIDPVGNFHMHNGAQFHRICWMGNPRSAPIKSSAGIMINYWYDLRSLEMNKHRFADEYEFLALGPDVQEILDPL